MPNTILDRQDIVNAKAAVTDYGAACKDLHDQLVKIIDDLRAKGFIGEASNGFNTFFTAIDPALSTNLYGEKESVTAMLNQLLESVEKALLDNVDPELGQRNSNAANAGAAANTNAVAG